MQQIKVFCDACEKECQPQDGTGTFGGVIARINIKLEKQAYKFVQDLCSECSEIVLNFISELKKDVKSRTADSGDKPNLQGDPSKK